MAVHPKKGATKPTRPMRLASFHLIRNTAGSSSAPARNVRTMAPVPERNLIQGSSVCRSVVPMVAPIISCATVPTTISDNAVATRSQIDNRVATSARPSHSAARSQVSVITRHHPAAFPARDRRANRLIGIPLLFAIFDRRGIGSVGVNHTKSRRDMGVKKPDLLRVNQRQKPFCFFVGDDELDFHRKRAGEFKKVRLVQVVMPSESCHGLKRRATADAELIRLLQQPFPYELMVMAMTLVHIKSQE